jgi:branched-subunit amino acid transport protein
MRLITLLKIEPLGGKRQGLIAHLLFFEVTSPKAMPVITARMISAAPIAVVAPLASDKCLSTSANARAEALQASSILCAFAIADTNTVS